jgi:hypothetical protein
VTDFCRVENLRQAVASTSGIQTRGFTEASGNSAIIPPISDTTINPVITGLPMITPSPLPVTAQISTPTTVDGANTLSATLGLPITDLDPSLLDILNGTTDLGAIEPLNDFIFPDFSNPFEHFAVDTYFNFPNDNEDEEEDGEFVPESSPHGESDDEDGDADTPSQGQAHGKGKDKAVDEQGNDFEDDDDEDEDEDEDDDEDDGEFEAMDEEENMFLPIEDVEVPQEAKEQAMAVLGVQGPGDLSRLIETVVQAGKSKEGVTPEVLKKLKALMTLAGPAVKERMKEL